MHTTTNNQFVTYTGFNKVETIVEGGKHYHITYGADRQRRKSVYSENGQVVKTVYYIGSFEREVTAQGTRDIVYVNATSGPVAAMVYQGNLSGLYYFGKDHLGSITSVFRWTWQLDVVERYSYDAWGRPRNPDNYADPAIDFPERLFSRGFTFHEHLAPFDLIDMNGRVYDPVVGRFLSPDPYVQAPDFSQSFNRYSYAWNNPLKFTDPSGEIVWLIPNIGWSKEGGLSIGLSLHVGLPGILSLNASTGYAFKSKDFNVTAGATAFFNTGYVSFSTQSGFGAGWSAGISPQMGFPISTNFTSVGVNYNFRHKNWSGNVSAWGVSKYGWKFNPSATAMVFPESTTNLIRGQGFKSNEKVFQRFVANKQQQKAIDYFGSEGTYDPSKTIGDPAVVYPGTGEIFYADFPFEGNFDRFSLIAHHEMRHRQNVLSGKYDGVEITAEIHGLEEYSTYWYSYRNQGLYPNHGINIPSRINGYAWQALMDISFTPQWWHFVYKIPRLW